MPAQRHGRAPTDAESAVITLSDQDQWIDKQSVVLETNDN
jgi:hypothetical protein